ncbi:ArdC-like ssDNA-binding domain-containing protein [Mesorhizobium sp. M1409]
MILRASKRYYTLLLWSEAVARGFVSPVWMTFKQSAARRGRRPRSSWGSQTPGARSTLSKKS